MAESVPQGGGSYEATPAGYTPEQPQGGGHYTPETPITPTTPQTPETPTTPTTPTTPETPETPEGKNYDGGVDTAPGIDPSQNGFVGWTPDPAENGNGTGSPNVNGSTAPGAESGGQAGGASQNTSPQVQTQEAGAGTSRTGEDTAAQEQAANAAAQQQQANQQAAQTEQQMSQPGAVDQGVRDAQAGIGANGRPIGTN